MNACAQTGLDKTETVPLVGGNPVPHMRTLLTWERAPCIFSLKQCHFSVVLLTKSSSAHDTEPAYKITPPKQQCCSGDSPMLWSGGPHVLAIKNRGVAAVFHGSLTFCIICGFNSYLALGKWYGNIFLLNKFLSKYKIHMAAGGVPPVQGNGKRPGWLTWSSCPTVYRHDSPVR